MSFGWWFDGLDSASAGFSVLDSFACASGATVSKSYSTDVLKFANHISLFITPNGGYEYELYQYPSLTASLNKAEGTATVTGTGGTTDFLVVVFIR